MSTFVDKAINPQTKKIQSAIFIVQENVSLAPVANQAQV